MNSFGESADPSTECVLLASIVTPTMSEKDNDASLDELARLAETLGLIVLGRVSQKRAGYGSATVFGEGKIAELAGKISELSASESRVSRVVFDRELSPLQSRNVEKAVNSKLAELKCDQEIQVADRTGIIIDIFSQHAKSRQARLQIEMARLKYSAPRLRERVEIHRDRQGGGIGAKGIGETAIELKRRQLRDRVAVLRRELETLESENEARREKRELQSAAIVGYTNAGKSSLMRSLTGSEVYVADQLFATVDVTTRQLLPAAVPPILITDTVGFVRFLPHNLVASFKSSLAEANHADLLLHVVDSSDPQFEIQMETTNSVLTELGADRQERQLVFNKIDKLSDTEVAQLSQKFPGAWFVSALSPELIRKMRDNIVGFFERDKVRVSVFVPFGDPKLMGEIRKVSTVVDESYDEHGTTLLLNLGLSDLDRLRSRFPEAAFKDVQRPNE